MAEQLPLSLSTSWNGLKHESPSDILVEARSLGFERLELYAHFTPPQLERLASLAQEEGLRITSLHNPCPVPVDDRGERARLGDWLASTDRRERSLAVEAARRTVDAAAALGAGAIVVHLGRVGVESRQAQVFEAIRKHGFESPAHRELIEQAWAEREAAKAPYLEAAISSAREIGEHARATGVHIGLECRDGYFEVPSLEEFELVFEACRNLPIGYWHDAGHGQKLENAGFLRHEELLRRHAPKTVGMHLHDTRMERDHQAPGQGETDFAMLAHYLRDGVVQTLELSPSVPPEHIGPGVEALRRVGLAIEVRPTPP